MHESVFVKVKNFWKDYQNTRVRMKNKTALLDNHPKISVKVMVQAAQPIQQDLSIEKGNFIFLLPFLLQGTWWNTQLSFISMLSRHLNHPRLGENCLIVWLLHNIFTYIDKSMTTSVPVSFWHSSLQANAVTSFRILQSFMKKHEPFSEIFHFHF